MKEKAKKFYWTKVFFLACAAWVFPSLACAAGFDGYTCDFDEETLSWNWKRNEEFLPGMDMIYGQSEEEEPEVHWIAVDSELMEEMEGSKTGVVFYVVKEKKYFFLPYEKASRIAEIHFLLGENHINIIWGDEEANYFEKGFSFPGFQEQGSEDEPTELNSAG
ncbi:MAG: hypothetical protein LBS00_11270 [Synergistaceae bacterium]|nr:hypothetical protein [Synergistaceae bacterium]